MARTPLVLAALAATALAQSIPANVASVYSEIASAYPAYLTTADPAAVACYLATNTAVAESIGSRIESIESANSAILQSWESQFLTATDFSGLPTGAIPTAETSYDCKTVSPLNTAGGSSTTAKASGSASGSPSASASGSGGSTGAASSSSLGLGVFGVAAAGILCAAALL